MAIQTVTQPDNMEHLTDDVPALFILAVAWSSYRPARKWLLCPGHTMGPKSRFDCQARDGIAFLLQLVPAHH
jgi:hypothetical protein